MAPAWPRPEAVTQGRRSPDRVPVGGVFAAGASHVARRSQGPARMAPGCGYFPPMEGSVKRA